jgi:hypothetical protein
MFGKGNEMISTVSILLVLMLTIGANPAYIDTSSSIVNPESTHSRININEKPLPEQKNVFVKMCQTQSKPLEKQGHTRFKSIISWKLHITLYLFNTNAIGSVIVNTDTNGDLVERVSNETYDMPTFTDAAKNWIDINRNFIDTDKLALHLKLFLDVYDSKKYEAKKYRTNLWTVLEDTLEGIAYDTAGRTDLKLTSAAFNHDGSSFIPFLTDLALYGTGSGVLKHYVPIGINFLKNRFPVLNKSVSGLVKKGTEKVKNFFDNIFGRGKTSTSGTTIATEGGVSLPLKNPKLKEQIEMVIKSFDETVKPQSGVWQGGRRGQRRGLFLNDKGKLPVKPHGYYMESDVWPGSPGNRNTERLIFGKGKDFIDAPVT